MEHNKPDFTLLEYITKSLRVEDSTIHPPRLWNNYKAFLYDELM
jgi:hypothetical protein